MAGDFASSSHCELWMKDREDVDRAHQRMVEEVFDNMEAVHLFYDYFVNIIEELAYEVMTMKQNDRFRQQIAATATVYFRRLYFVTTPADLHPSIGATACVVLACKTEEFGGIDMERTTKSAMQLFKDLWLGAETEHPSALHAATYHSRRNPHIQLVIETEFAVLHLLRCSTVVFQPYRSLREYCKRCQDLTDRHEELLRCAWMVVNDTLHTDACLVFSPDIIALAAMFLAASTKDIPIMPWFAQNSVPRHQLAEVVQVMLDYYEKTAQLRASGDLENKREQLVFEPIRRVSRAVDWVFPPQHPRAHRRSGLHG